MIKRIYYFILFISVIFLFLQLVSISQEVSEKTSIRIYEPGNGKTLYGTTHVVKGSSSGYNKSVHIYVLVHPKKTDKWWVQNLPVVDEYGNWETTVYLGTSFEGNFEEYIIEVIITKEILLEGNTFKRNDLPDYITQDEITVKRNDLYIVTNDICTLILAIVGIIIGYISLKYAITSRQLRSRDMNQTDHLEGNKKKKYENNQKKEKEKKDVEKDEKKI